MTEARLKLANDWQPYFGLEVEPDTGAFTVALNEDGTRRLRAVRVENPSTDDRTTESSGTECHDRSLEVDHHAHTAGRLRCVDAVVDRLTRVPAVDGAVGVVAERVALGCGGRRGCREDSAEVTCFRAGTARSRDVRNVALSLSRDESVVSQT